MRRKGTGGEEGVVAVEGERPKRRPFLRRKGPNRIRNRRIITIRVNILIGERSQVPFLHRAVEAAAQVAAAGRKEACDFIVVRVGDGYFGFSGANIENLKTFIDRSRKEGGNVGYGRGLGGNRKDSVDALLVALKRRHDRFPTKRIISENKDTQNGSN